ncbi:MAG: hypothetical protein ACE5FC_08615 [Myxococcota bacterium]
MNKHYEVTITRDGKKAHLNHFMQELVASSLVGMLGPLSAVDGEWKNVVVSVERLPEPVEVIGRESR